MQHPGPNEKGLAWFIQLTEEYKSMFRMRMGPFMTTVLLVHPDAVKDLLKTAEPKQMSSASGYSFMVPWLGKRSL